MTDFLWCLGYILITWMGFECVESFSLGQVKPTGKTDSFPRNRFRNGAVSIVGSGVAYWLCPVVLNVKNHYAAPGFIFGGIVLWRIAVRKEWRAATPTHRKVLGLTDLGRAFLQVWSSNCAGAVAQLDSGRLYLSIAGFAATLLLVQFVLRPANKVLLGEVKQQEMQKEEQAKKENEKLLKEVEALKKRIKKLEEENESLRWHLRRFLNK